METLPLHVDLTTRRKARSQDDAQAALWLATLFRRNPAEMPVPPGLGRRVTRERQG